MKYDEPMPRYFCFIAGCPGNHISKHMICGVSYEAMNNIPNPEHKDAARAALFLLERLDALALNPEQMSPPLSEIYLQLMAHRFALERLAHSVTDVRE